ncbi:flagellar hook-basal body complex protein FliE [Clostridium fermenticellae]|uniref:Flagellar hook-basal body complex protein FliE n=1 Tax=Clostridium fermenticellae TaxID=2068654 RepID=A0A386H4U9_9CLOT|nr:flagellar hook-basal body complex protein FliE [Clostridium fermenticellae]AYD40686.1 flagellar hook-basal body complex protein FliE [Clostridium fermenticellae]
MIVNEFTPDSKVFDSIVSTSKDKTQDSTKDQVGFGDFLKEKLDEVNSKQLDADNTTQSFIDGDDVDIHKVMLDTEEAEMSLELAVQVRNKLLDAYQEINRTQL